VVYRWLPVTALCLVFTPNVPAAHRSELPYHFECSANLDRPTCDRQLELLREIVERQHAPLPAGWSWLVVADSDWPSLQQRYRLKYDFAFTHMSERRIIFNSLLFQRFGRPIWEWAVAHESAHVACDLVDEKMADRVAQELAYRGFISLEKSCRAFITEAQRHGGE
jgi:hypothetical protein